jgi:predicted SAM-dependent methyltransferase
MGKLTLHRIALLLFSHRLLALSRWDAHFLWVRLVNLLTGQKGRIARFLATRASPVYLNFGSGPRGKSGSNWLNIDGYPDTNVHFCLDFSRPLPIPDNALDGIFCEHVMEHFTYEAGLQICAELYRTMRPGGVIRIIVPDAERIVRTYCDDPERLIAYRGGPTAMHAVNELFRQRYEHQFLFDWETMRRMLAEAGFQDIRRCDLHYGRCPALLIDDDKYAWESLYVEAAREAVSSAVPSPGAQDWVALRK